MTWIKANSNESQSHKEIQYKEKHKNNTKDNKKD